MTASREFIEAVREHFGDLIQVKPKEERPVWEDYFGMAGGKAGEEVKLAEPSPRVAIAQAAGEREFVLQPGATLRHLKGEVHNGNSMPMLVKLMPDGPPKIRYPYFEDMIEAAVEHLSGHKLTATEAILKDQGALASAPRFGTRTISASETLAINRTIEKQAATIKAKDEIIAGLQGDIKRLLDVNEANFREVKQARIECDEARDKLAETERYAKTLEATIAELNRQLGNEPKPNTRDMSRVAKLGESHKQGLRIHDHY